jgi:deoxycytidylate deaminase
MSTVSILLVADPLISRSRLVLKGIVGYESFVHVAIIFNKRTKQLLSWSLNEKLNDGGFKNNVKIRHSIHAEMNAIYKYRERVHKNKLTNSMIRGNKVMFVFRISKSGLIGNSLPCTGCSNHLNKGFDIGITSLLYSNENRRLTLTLIHDLLINANVRFSKGDSRSYSKNSKNFNNTSKYKKIRN